MKSDQYPETCTETFALPDCLILDLVEKKRGGEGELSDWDLDARTQGARD